MKASKNLAKARRQVARVEERIGSIRRDWQHKTTTAVIRENQTIAIEDLNVAGMTARAAGTRVAPGKNVRQKSGLNRAILAVGFGELRRQLRYKALWSGRTLVEIDRWYPSSKTCSACGAKRVKLSLGTREWTCEACGVRHDRDLNAARNILAEGKRMLVDAKAAA